MTKNIPLLPTPDERALQASEIKQATTHIQLACMGVDGQVYMQHVEFRPTLPGGMFSEEEIANAGLRLGEAVRELMKTCGRLAAKETRSDD